MEDIDLTEIEKDLFSLKESVSGLAGDISDMKESINRYLSRIEKLLEKIARN